MNSRISEKVSSPHTESANHQNTDLKANWNILIGKDDEAQSADQPDSPKIENLVEPIEPPGSTFKTFRQHNMFHVKRAKLESDEHESNAHDHVACHMLSQQEPQDDCDAVGKCVTAQLRQMSKMQKILAQRLISEVCFKGQLQALQLNTTLNNQSTIFQQHQAPQPVPMFVTRPAHFSRGSDFLLMHQQNMKQNMQQNMSVNPTSVASIPSQFHQNLVNLQQPEHMSLAAINHATSLEQSETILNAGSKFIP